MLISRNQSQPQNILENFRIYGNFSFYAFNILRYPVQIYVQSRILGFEDIPTHPDLPNDDKVPGKRDYLQPVEKHHTLSTIFSIGS